MKQNRLFGAFCMFALLFLSPIAWAQPSELEQRVARLERAVTKLQNVVENQSNRIAKLRTRIRVLEDSSVFALEPFVSIDENELEGVPGPHILFEGANVHVRSGLDGTAEGLCDADGVCIAGEFSGLGNLFIGYNEAPDDWEQFVENRAGAHNLVVGRYHLFNNYGGFVAGENNAVVAPAASISGGWGHLALGIGSSVSGGYGNETYGNWSSVSGGSRNSALSQDSSVSGGNYNEANGEYSSVSGGKSNHAEGDYSSVSGGALNHAEGLSSSVCGGYEQNAMEEHECVCPQPN